MGYTLGNKIGGRFEVHRILGGAGHSGMGVVYVCHDHKQGGVLALKTYQESADKSLIEYFKRGALAWTELGKHPYIVQANGVMKLADQLFISLEYIAPDTQGRNTITHYVRHPVALDRLLQWCLQFCDAMEYARTKGVTPHRDIKPDNLMVTNNGTLKVSDFDLSGAGEGSQLRNVVEKAQENATPGLTFVHGIDAIGAAGTLPWMAPEQFEGRASVQSDIYSIGVVLYQLASGHLPITTGENGNWHKAHQEMAPQALDHPLWPLIDRCLAKDPTARFGGSNSNEGFNDMRQEVVALWQQHLPDRRLPTPPASDELEAGDLNDKAISLSYLGLHVEALQLYQRAVKLKPDHAPTYLNAGVAFYDKGDIENAKKACRKALKLDPSMAAAHYNYGMICKKDGRLEEAEGCFRRAIQLEPDQYNAHEQLGIALSETGRHQEAVDLISKAIEYDPLYGGFHYTMGVALEKARHHQEALKCYKEAVRLAPGKAMYHYGLGNGYRFVGDMRRAVDAWMRTLELDHTHRSARFNIGLAYEQNNDRVTAYRYYHESTEVVPEFAQVYYNLGLMLANAGLFGEGADAFENFVQYGADNPELAPHMQNARSYVNSMREDEAQAQQQMIHPEAVYNRGLAYLNLGRLEEAREWLEKSLGMKPDYPHALCGMGIYHENLNEFAKAAEYYQKSIDVDPSYTIAWNNLGWARYQRQDYDGARQAYNKFIEVGGEFSDWIERAHQMLAEIDQKQNAAN